MILLAGIWYPRVKLKLIYLKLGVPCQESLTGIQNPIWFPIWVCQHNSKAALQRMCDDVCECGCFSLCSPRPPEHQCFDNPEISSGSGHMMKKNYCRVFVIGIVQCKITIILVSLTSQSTTSGSKERKSKKRTWRNVTLQKRTLM
jgi:hypothetical protein